MEKGKSVFIVILYLLLFLFAVSYFGYFVSTSNKIAEGFKLMLQCVLIGGFGGILYCLRGVYLNYSVHNRWSIEWLPWYFIRPFVSLICGGISFLFLKAGLLILEAQKESDASNLGFFALAFIAGMNVDKFVSKIEDLAQATWGIEKSRTSTKNEK